MSLPVLYSFRRCPYAMRARLAVMRSGIFVELREVVLSDKPPELAAASPKATVPVLVLDDGRVIDESYDIMKWALELCDPDGWLDVDRDDCDALVRDNDERFKPSLDGYKYPEYHPAKTAAQHRDDAEGFLGRLERMLGDNGFLFGAHASLADFALVPFVRQFASVDRAWFDCAPYPDLRRWLDGLIGSRLFESIMQKYPQWRAGDAVTRFGPSAG